MTGYTANDSANEGGFTATPDTERNTKKVETVSPLSVALVLKVTFIELLPNASHPFLIPLTESALREFTCLFHAEEKVKETMSNPNYVSSSAKKLGIVLQAMPEVQGMVQAWVDQKLLKRGLFKSFVDVQFDKYLRWLSVKKRNSKRVFIE